jgi:hypothetical protein
MIHFVREPLVFYEKQQGLARGKSIWKYVVRMLDALGLLRQFAPAVTVSSPDETFRDLPR